MRIGAILSPVASWESVLDAAIAADELGLDTVGLWDHYHSAKPEWAYVAGWSAHAAIAQATSRVRITPAVLNTLHYELGVLAKESATLSIVSGGRFEMAVGAGDWPESFEAWGQAFPDRETRIARFVETLTVLKQLWKGELVDFDGRFHSLTEAACTPAPESPPRVVVGVGKSVALAEAELEVADELNVYADEVVLAKAQELVGRAGRDVPISLFLSWEWDKWPNDPAAELARWRELGVNRALISIGAADIPARLEQLAQIAH
jgi:alkanesulfonate monooxygenase SsuD/methylene tetrahydromethanopterin reductase-like flavin-dependent oxidoreductase (luciferase family)